jgi:hypothetical protein
MESNGKMIFQRPMFGLLSMISFGVGHFFSFLVCLKMVGGVPKWTWMVYSGNSQSKMDENWWYPHDFGNLWLGLTRNLPSCRKKNIYMINQRFLFLLIVVWIQQHTLRVSINSLRKSANGVLGQSPDMIPASWLFFVMSHCPSYRN